MIFRTTKVWFSGNIACEFYKNTPAAPPRRCPRPRGSHSCRSRLRCTPARTCGPPGSPDPSYRRHSPRHRWCARSTGGGGSGVGGYREVDNYSSLETLGTNSYLSQNLKGKKRYKLRTQRSKVLINILVQTV